MRGKGGQSRNFEAHAFTLHKRCKCPADAPCRGGAGTQAASQASTCGLSAPAHSLSLSPLGSQSAREQLLLPSCSSAFVLSPHAASSHAASSQLPLAGLQVVLIGGGLWPDFEPMAGSALARRWLAAGAWLPALWRDDHFGGSNLSKAGVASKRQPSALPQALRASKRELSSAMHKFPAITKRRSPTDFAGPSRLRCTCFFTFRWQRLIAENW